MVMAAVLVALGRILRTAIIIVTLGVMLAGMRGIIFMRLRWPGMDAGNQYRHRGEESENKTHGGRVAKKA